MTLNTRIPSLPWPYSYRSRTVTAAGLLSANFAFLIALFIGTYLMPITYNDSYLMSYTNKQSNMPISIIQGDMHLYAKTVSNVQASNIWEVPEQIMILKGEVATKSHTKGYQCFSQINVKKVAFIVNGCIPSYEKAK